ncbi:MAG: hypothetical protein Q8P90_02930 [bacterium]|nr:hypothetical protein [bacterium]
MENNRRFTLPRPKAEKQPPKNNLESKQDTDYDEDEDVSEPDWDRDIEPYQRDRIDERQSPEAPRPLSPTDPDFDPEKQKRYEERWRDPDEANRNRDRGTWIMKSDDDIEN